MIVDQHELRVFSGSTELEPLENAGTLTLDRGWSPHVQGTLTVRAPDSNATTARGAIITIELSQRFGDLALTRDLTDMYGGEVTAELTTAYAGGTTADMTGLIDAASWNTPSRPSSGRTFSLIVTGLQRTRDEHTLQLRSNEAIVDQIVWYKVDGTLEGVPLTFEAETAAQYIRAVLAAFVPEATLYPDLGFTGFGWAGSFVDTATPVALSTTSHTMQVGVAPFSDLQQYMTVTRQVLYAPGDGTLILSDQAAFTGPAFTAHYGENLVDWQVNLEGQLGLSIYRFVGSPTNPAARPVHSPLAFPAANFPHTGVIEVPTVGPTTPGGFSNGQQSLMSALSAPIGLDSSPVRLVTVSNYNVRPGSPITYTLPDESPVNNSIDAITWQLGGRWEMDVWV